MNKLISEWLNKWTHVEVLGTPHQVRSGTQEKVRAEYLDLGVLDINRNKWGYLERETEESWKHSPKKQLHVESLWSKSRAPEPPFHVLRWTVLSSSSEAPGYAEPLGNQCLGSISSSQSVVPGTAAAALSDNFLEVWILWPHSILIKSEILEVGLSKLCFSTFSK